MCYHLFFFFYYHYYSAYIVSTYECYIEYNKRRLSKKHGKQLLLRCAALISIRVFCWRAVSHHRDWGNDLWLWPAALWHCTQYTQKEREKGFLRPRNHPAASLTGYGLIDTRHIIQQPWPIILIHPSVYYALQLVYYQPKLHNNHYAKNSIYSFPHNIIMMMIVELLNWFYCYYVPLGI